MSVLASVSCRGWIEQFLTSVQLWSCRTPHAFNRCMRDALLVAFKNLLGPATPTVLHSYTLWCT